MCAAPAAANDERMVLISTTVDGADHADEVEPRLLLVHYLRTRLGRTGTSEQEVRDGLEGNLILGLLLGHRRRIVIMTAAAPPGGYPPARTVLERPRE
jgi:hypothetical protein